MKQTLLLLFATFSLTTIWSQCPQPEFIDFEHVNDSTYTITFESEVAGTYNLQMNNPYMLSPVGIPNGEVTEGINTIELAFTSSFIPGEPFAAFDLSEPHLLLSNLRVVCSETEISESEYFYVSNASMILNQNLSCENALFPFSETGYSNSPEQNISITIPANEEEIDEVSVTIDIACDFISEITEYQIELYHPSGISIILDTLSLFKPKSVIYTDNGTQTDLDGLEFSGILIPDEPLSSFAGLSPAGEWEISITPAEIGWFVDPIDVLGVCLNLNTTNCSSSFSGKAFYDLNQNNTMDEDEPSPSFPIIQKNGSEEFFGGISGEFWNCPEAGAITLEALNPAMYYESSQTSFSIEEGDQLSGILVPLTPSEFLPEVVVDLFSFEPNRPGFEAGYFAQVTNNGTICQDGVSIEIEFPDYVEILSSEEPNLVISDNTAFLEIDQSCPFVSHGFQLTVLLDSTVVLGTILEAHITADIAEDDPNPSNNTFTSAEEVVGSYDPNDKQVSATTIGDEFLEDGSPLKYTIRFQNTGTFYAERVVITDTIDADLDINSLNIISTSHNMELSREGNVLYFEFDQIFLPDSTTDFDGSIGHVRYEINPLPTFSEGETIENTAYIYFDFNEPIVTNTVVTEFGNPLTVSTESAFETRLFPNPANQNITINWGQDVAVDRIEIFDLSGRILQENNIRNLTQTTLDVSDLASGIYLLKVNANELISSSIFMKE